jgi:hypothetical protein
MSNIMEVIKKNLISVISGVIAIAAIAVAFTMLSGEKDELNKELEARKSVHGSLSQLLNGNRTLPTVSITPDAQAEKLPRFPSQKIIDQGDAMVKELEKASKEILEAAVKMNKHELQEPGSLPSPPPGMPYRFRESYQRFFPPPPTSPLQSQLAKDLGAGMPPTPEEIRFKVEEKSNQIKKDRLIQTATGFNNSQQVQEEIAQMARELPRTLRDQIAASSRVYINPQTFTAHPQILAAAGAPTDVSIYEAQLMLWMQQDVVAAVNDANKDSKSIKDSVVKHLVRVTAMPSPIMPTGGTPSVDPDAPVPKEPAVSPTGRVCNGMYDVYHIQVEADVDAARLPDFLRAFGHNRFMTPLWADLRSVDLAMERAAGHDYGDKPVVNAKVQLEVLYLRAWDKPLMPKDVRAKFGIPDDQGQPAQPTAPSP